MSSEDSTITGDYSDYDILEGKKDTITKNNDVWIFKKNIYIERKGTINSLQF